MITKRRVVSLFLHGLSYDEIAQRTGIGKGSVTNIIDEFRNGGIAAPQDLSEYVDALRKAVVDMNKQGASVSQVMSCTGILHKINEMGIGIEEVELSEQSIIASASLGVSK